jgi:hypothetical protein
MLFDALAMEGTTQLTVSGEVTIQSRDPAKPPRKFNGTISLSSVRVDALQSR